MKKLLALALTLTLCLSMMVTIGLAVTTSFLDAYEIDVNHEKAVSECADRKIINGYPDGTFQPRGQITRAEMCKMLCVAMTGQESAPVVTLRDPSYFDIMGHWAEGYIEFCTAKGIAAGMGDGRFEPSNDITGMQAAKMILVSLCGKNGDDYIGSSWAVNVNADALLCGLFVRLDDVDMMEPMSREHIAQMIWNALKD